jgi:hypothetical protein
MCVVNTLRHELVTVVSHASGLDHENLSGRLHLKLNANLKHVSRASNDRLEV